MHHLGIHACRAKGSIVFEELGDFSSICCTKLGMVDQNYFIQIPQVVSTGEQCSFFWRTWAEFHPQLGRRNHHNRSL